MSEPEIKSVLAIYETIQKNYSAIFDPDFSCNLHPFASFENNEILDPGPFIKISHPHDPFHLGFFQVGIFGSRGKYPRGNIVEFQSWGILKLTRDYGHILIKPKTMLDKIHELIHPIELDFEDDIEFSKKFYVLAEYKAKANLYLTPSFRNHIKTIQSSGLIIEIIDNTLIIGNEGRIDLNSAVEFVRFMNSISGDF